VDEGDVELEVELFRGNRQSLLGILESCLVGVQVTLGAALVEPGTAKT